MVRGALADHRQRVPTASRAENSTRSRSIRPASTFERSRISLEQLQQVLAGVPDVAEVLLLTVVDRSEHAVEEDLGEADHGVERCAQLVRHAGEELRLVAADDLQLDGLAFELAEQAGVEDGERRLAGERLQQVARVLRDVTGPLAPHDEHPDDATFASIGTATIERQPASYSGCWWTSRARPDMSVTCRARPSFAARPMNVPSSVMRARRSCSSTSSLVRYAVRTKNSCWSSSNSINDPPSVPDSCTVCMTIVDSTMSRSRLELHGLTDLAERFELPELQGEVGAAGLEGVHQVEVVHGDRRCGRERGQQRLGAVVERVDLGAPHRQHADDVVVEQHRGAHDRAVPGDPLRILAPVVRVGQDVADLRGPPVEPDPTGERVVVEQQGVARHVLEEVRGQPGRAGQPVGTALDEVQLHAVRPAQPSGAVHDGPEDEVEIGGGPTHRGEHLVGGRDLLACVGQIATQPLDVRRVSRGRCPPPSSRHRPRPMHVAA